LHDVEDRRRYDVDRHFVVPKPWTSKEELRTISGYIGADAYATTDTYDPICDNCFDLYESVSKFIPHLQARPTIVKPVSCALSKKLPYRPLIPKKPIQPHATISRVIPYRPRLGHIGYVRDGGVFSAAELAQFRTIFNFRLAWPDRYMIP
jgi:hypothetical protein